MRLHLTNCLRTLFLMTGFVSVSLLALATGEARGSNSWERQADALLGKMTLEEKIGQMTQIDLAAIKVLNFGLTGVLVFFLALMATSNMAA